MNTNLFYRSQEKSREGILRQKLSQFYAEGLFCDVAVQVEEQQVFRCHRVVLASFSEYFQALFRNNVGDCCVQQTKLLDINAEVFEEILKFCYTKKEPSITNDNVFDLLRASDFLCMQSFVELCVDYICHHKSSIENIFEIFSFAHATNNKSLMRIICDYVIKKFNKLSQKEEFLTMSVDALKMVLKKYESPYEIDFKSSNLSQMFRDENILLDALICWVKYSPRERAVYSEEIFQVVDFRKISSEFFRKKFKIDIFVDTPSPKKYLCEYLSSNYSICDDFVASPVTISKLGLHVYVNFTFCGFEDDTPLLKIFSTNKYKHKWSFCGQKHPSPYNIEANHMKVITLGESPNYLYCFRYPESPYDNAPTFFTSTSVTLDVKHRLATPPRDPLEVRYIDVCGMPNSTSIYSCYRHWNEPSGSISQINHYNCHLNKWFPVPEMGTRMATACIAADNNLLYLFGHFETNIKTVCGVQAYDYRVSKWLKLSTTNETYNLYAVASTFLNGRIYVSDGSSVEVLDPAAGKWETLSSNALINKKFYSKTRMVAYENQLWIIFEGMGKDSNHYIQVFNPRDKTRQISKSLNEIIYHHTDDTGEESYPNDDFSTTGEIEHGRFFVPRVVDFVVF